MITRGQIKHDVLGILNKSSTTKGFYTDSKFDIGMREGMAYIATHCFMMGQGWLNRIREISVSSGAVSVDVPRDVTFIDQLRIQIGNSYYPMTWDQRREAGQIDPTVGVNQYPYSYRILNDAIYWNPAISSDGVLLLEYTAYSRAVINDGDVLPASFNEAMYWFLVWRICSFMVKGMGQAVPDWTDLEAQWYNQMSQIISRRNNQITYVRSFDG